MSDIRMPHAYENSVSIEDAGPLLSNLGRSAFVIAGRRAFAAAGQALSKALDGQGIDYVVHYLEGEPTVSRADAFAAAAAGRDLVIALGGGKVMDLAKAVSRRTGARLVTVPTIAATCAAWTSVYLLYTEDHKVDRHEWIDGVPELVLVDKSVILAAPERYLFSGVGDALAKWYEECHAEDDSTIDLLYRLRTRIGSLTRDTLEHEFLDRYDPAAPQDVVYELKSEAVDSIMLLAGLPVGFRPHAPHKAVPRLELAHAFYNSWTWVPTAIRPLHGELVSFGVAVQLAQQGADEATLTQYLQRIHRIGLPVTLAQTGIERDEQVHTLATYVVEGIPGYSGPYRQLTVAGYELALREADRIGRSVISADPQ
ncbi:iron-containing alcohol dehydrogenase [Bifidobacterium scaligerum]|uniref:Alcohol dehydrogenase iron-type/glycerol dehydrogenase GldA domain-containing protein n=1 Tax=Bifidobacterium scaligerum TaxID=2052656 RepID=A0A2M9HPQ2_9BIFI|nr:iron-containing alcohol dehydrogenase [Bifidobacterium scaligerum]PJM78761.1 hypothetical protein CUU80_07255 [Bifidobacterium scaligerum]